jgi:predicted acetyltransferase
MGGVCPDKKVPNVSEGAIVWDMAEFFLLRRYRGQGIGTHAAHSVWQLFPGQWQVRVMEANAPALRFWAHALECFFGRAVPASRFERDSAAWSLFSFSVPKS